MPALLSILLGCVACGERIDEEQRSIFLHQLPECPLPQPTPVIDLEAFGDFPGHPFAAETPRKPGQRLLFPDDTRSVVARTGGTSMPFVGLAEIPSEGDIEVLLWPAATSCTLAKDAQYPRPGAGRAFAHHPERSIVLIAGGDAGQSSAVVGGLTFHTGTGHFRLVDAAERHVMLEPRAFAAAAPFGRDLIVTGGEDPLLPSERGRRAVLRSAEVYSVDEERFLPELIELRNPRSHHAAVVLASGEVLLVGGRTEEGVALRRLEAISPHSRLSSLGDFEPLQFGRISPTVIGLEGGGWLVVGGLTEEGEPVPVAEWLSADASSHLGLIEGLPPAYEVSAAPMPGGGALIVVGCGPVPSGDSESSAACVPCASGCLPEQQAFWMRPDRTLDAIATPVPLVRPWLVPAAHGAPWLITGNVETPWLRFNPWQGRFEPAPLRLPAPLLGQGPLALDPGAFVWIEEDLEPRLVGVRTDVRHRFSRDFALLARTDPFDPSWPLHLSPSRKNGARYERNLLHLETAPTWLTDVEFADVDVTLTFSGPPPTVFLGDEQWGSEERPWPAGSGNQVQLERRGSRVTVRRGSERTTYDGAPLERLPLGFAASAEGPTSLEGLDVVRVAEP